MKKNCVPTLQCLRWISLSCQPGWWRISTWAVRKDARRRIDRCCLRVSPPSMLVSPVSSKDRSLSSTKTALFASVLLGSNMSNNLDARRRGRQGYLYRNAFTIEISSREVHWYFRKEGTRWWIIPFVNKILERAQLSGIQQQATPFPSFRLSVPKVYLPARELPLRMPSPALAYPSWSFEASSSIHSLDWRRTQLVEN